MSEFRRLGEGPEAQQILRGLQLTDDPPGAHLPYGCEKCDGYGNLIDERGARACECKKEYYLKKRLSLANIPPSFMKMSLSNFRQDSQAQKNLHGFATLYCNRYSVENNKGLLLSGGPGTGKTHLAVAILQDLIARGHVGVFFDTQDLLRQIKRSFDPRTGPDLQQIQDDLERDIVLLDDFGSTRITGWVYDEIYAIINRRYCLGKTTLITTQDFDDLAARVGDGIYSRLLEMCIIKNCGDQDFREKNLAEMLTVDDIA